VIHTLALILLVLYFLLLVNFHDQSFVIFDLHHLEISRRDLVRHIREQYSVFLNLVRPPFAFLLGPPLRDHSH